MGLGSGASVLARGKGIKAPLFAGPVQTYPGVCLPQPSEGQSVWSRNNTSQARGGREVPAY